VVRIRRTRRLRALVLALASLMLLGDVTAAVLAQSANAWTARTLKASRKRSVTKKKKKRKKTTSVRGPRGERGPTGPQGPAGVQGPAGPAGSAKAYGGVIGRGIAIADSVSPEPVYLFNVSVWSGNPGSPAGTYCLTLQNGVTAFAAVVVVSPLGLPWPEPTPPSTEPGLPWITWVQGAPACPSGRLEVRTFTYTVNAGTPTLNPSDFVSFSFVVP